MKHSNFGPLLRAARLRSGKSMRDVAGAIGVSVSYVSDIERGMRKPPSEEKILKMAAAIGADPEAACAWAKECGESVVLRLDGKAAVARAFATRLASVWEGMAEAAIQNMLDILESEEKSHGKDKRIEN